MRKLLFYCVDDPVIEPAITKFRIMSKEMAIAARYRCRLLRRDTIIFRDLNPVSDEAIPVGLRIPERVGTLGRAANRQDGADCNRQPPNHLIPLLVKAGTIAQPQSEVESPLPSI